MSTYYAHRPRLAFRRLFFAAAVAAILVFPRGRAGEMLTVYTASEYNLIPFFTRAFRAANPDYLIKWVRGSTGEIAERIQKEKGDPQADAVFGLSATTLMNLKKQDVFETYRPQGFENLDPGMRDPDNGTAWVGINAWAGNICINLELKKKFNLPTPKTWADLLDPVFKGHVVMPNPGATGTGYLIVSGWLETMGDDAGWAFMDELHKNVREYTTSGSRPGKMAMAGDVAVGLTSEALIGTVMKTQKVIEVIYPAGAGLPWDLEGAAMLKGSRYPEEAKKLMDFAASAAAGRAVANSLYFPARTDVKLNPAAQQARALLAKKDLAKSAARRDAVVAEWKRRYDKGK